MRDRSPFEIDDDRACMEESVRAMTSAPVDASFVAYSPRNQTLKRNEKRKNHGRDSNEQHNCDLEVIFSPKVYHGQRSKRGVLRTCSVVESRDYNEQVEEASVDVRNAESSSVESVPMTISIFPPSLINYESKSDVIRKEAANTVEDPETYGREVLVKTTDKKTRKRMTIIQPNRDVLSHNYSYFDESFNDVGTEMIMSFSNSVSIDEQQYDLFVRGQSEKEDDEDRIGIGKGNIFCFPFCGDGFGDDEIHEIAALGYDDISQIENEYGIQVEEEDNEDERPLGDAKVDSVKTESGDLTDDISEIPIPPSNTFGKQSPSSWIPERKLLVKEDIKIEKLMEEAPKLAQQSISSNFSIDNADRIEVMLAKAPQVISILNSVSPESNSRIEVKTAESPRVATTNKEVRKIANANTGNINSNNAENPVVGKKWLSWSPLLTLRKWRKENTKKKISKSRTPNAMTATANEIVNKIPNDNYTEEKRDDIQTMMDFHNHHDAKRDDSFVKNDSLEDLLRTATSLALGLAIEMRDNQTNYEMHD